MIVIVVILEMKFGMVFSWKLAYREHFIILAYIQMHMYAISYKWKKIWIFALKLVLHIRWKFVLCCYFIVKLKSKFNWQHSIKNVKKNSFIVIHNILSLNWNCCCNVMLNNTLRAFIQTYFTFNNLTKNNFNI